MQRLKQAAVLYWRLSSFNKYQQPWFNVYDSIYVIHYMHISRNHLELIKPHSVWLMKANLIYADVP